MPGNFNVKWLPPMIIRPERIRKGEIATFTSRFVAEEGTLRKATVHFWIDIEGTTKPKLIKTKVFENVAEDVPVQVETSWRADRTGEHWARFIFDEDIRPQESNANRADNKLAQKFRVYNRAAQVLTRAVITSLSVNSVSSATIYSRIDCYRHQGIQCAVTADGPQPIQYRYILNLLQPGTGGIIDFTSPWVSQNSYTISLTYDQVLQKLLSQVDPSGTIPVAVLGSVEVEARSETQIDPPDKRELPINFYIG